MKQTIYALIASFSLTIFVVAIAIANAEKEFPDKHLEVVLRNIGHQLLLRSGDSTSRVLPVREIGELTYQISFEKGFGFTPDTLMRLVHQQLAKTDMHQNYIVSVNDCNENKTIFAYEINSFKGDLKPCGERKQESACYVIQIEFLAIQSFNYAWLLTGIIPVGFAFFYLYRRQRKHRIKTLATQDQEELVSAGDTVLAPEYQQLGKFRFYREKGILDLHDTKIALSEKEIKALNIFLSSQNLVVTRDRFRKEIWENEGVFVIDRNVDVLVSKLRKKLSNDPQVKLVNVHGKGYKLMTE